MAALQTLQRMMCFTLLSYPLQKIFRAGQRITRCKYTIYSCPLLLLHYLTEFTSVYSIKRMFWSIFFCLLSRIRLDWTSDVEDWLYVASKLGYPFEMYPGQVKHVIAATRYLNHLGTTYPILCVFFSADYGRIRSLYRGSWRKLVSFDKFMTMLLNHNTRWSSVSK